MVGLSWTLMSLWWLPGPKRPGFAAVPLAASFQAIADNLDHRCWAADARRRGSTHDRKRIQLTRVLACRRRDHVTALQVHTLMG